MRIRTSTKKTTSYANSIPQTPNPWGMRNFGGVPEWNKLNLQ